MTKSKDEIQVIILNDLLSIHNRSVEMTNRLHQNLEDNLAYLQELVIQLSQSTGPFLTKTPKILRKKAVPRIETILENEVLGREYEEGENSCSTASFQSVDMEERKASVLTGKSQRIASKKAVNNIKKQSIEKSRQLESQDNSTSAKRVKRQNSVKRKKSGVSSSDEDDNRSSSKYSKVHDDPGKPKRSKRIIKKKSEQVVQATTLKTIQETKDIEEKNIVELSKLRCSDRLRSKTSQDGEANKINDTIIAPSMDNVEEPSMYEDAIEKPTPIMNSTMKHSSENKLNATVVLERLPQHIKLNETVVIKRESHTDSKKRSSAKKSLQRNSSMQSKKETMEFNNYDELITEDESSLEIKKSKYNMKKEMKMSLSNDEEIPNTPMKTRFRDTSAQEKINKTTYKSSALFNPYGKESVKKRVEAFEQVVMQSPKSVDVDVASRLTRSKARAMNTVNTVAENGQKNVKQILARKSLAKAKKISLAKQVKNTEEFKEVKAVNKNSITMPERITKLINQDKIDRPNVKQIQLKITPISKLRMVQPPTSINRLQTPTNTQNILNYPKVLSAQRANIFTGIDSFIPKSITKTNSTNSEKTEDKKRHEEDVKKKREETLRLMTEEKRRKRQEKELKNKLAREAKEKQEQEKRQKAEKEKEEKAKLALLMQEKQREEMEKKRFAQIQRAQEKEERRKLEEQQRVQKLQEQEETERLLAEQRRREQEAERRREAEARAQQQAASEALKQRQLMVAAAQAKSKPQESTNYKLESEPDDESDDESRPKHEIPYWAQPHNRKAQLAMQRHIPQELIYKFFNTRKCTPDLTELFQGIDRNRLKRTSSAIWKTPPRTEMMESNFESLMNRN